MNGEQSIVHTPQEGETLAEYLKRFKESEVQEISRNRELLNSFCRVLQESFRDFERTEDGLENLWNIINRGSDFDHLLNSIRQLEPVRQKLLKSLADQEKEISNVTKLCTAGRLIGSTADIVGTVGGLASMDSNPGLASLSFNVATAFGMLGFVSTVSEMSILKSSFDSLLREIKKDQELFAPIQRWYQQTYELEEAMQAIFPFDITNRLIAEFAGNTELSPLNLLSTLLSSIAEHDFRRLTDEGLIRNLINFTLYPASQDWLEWIIFRRHAVILDVTRIILQLQHSSFKFAMCQSIPALSVGDQSIGSFAVWGRLGLNLLSLTEAARSLWSSDIPAVSAEIRHLGKHLETEMRALQRIAEFVRLRRRNANQQ